MEIITDARSSSDEELQNAQNGLLEARAKYRLRNDAIESVMVANPILKAVHSGTQASPIERHVLPSRSFLTLFLKRKV